MTESIAKYFNNLEFTGLMRKEIESVVRTENDLSMFKLFVIENDDVYNSRLELIHRYIAHLRDTTDVMTEDCFIDLYNRNSMPENRTLVLSDLYLSYFSKTSMEKLDKSLSNGLTLSFWYNRLLECRGKYNHAQAVDLIIIGHELKMNKVLD